MAGVNRLAVHQPDLDGRLLELLGEVAQHLGRGQRIAAGEHQAGRARARCSSSAAMPLAASARCASVFFTTTYSTPAGAEPAAELGHPEHVQAAEVGDVDVGRALELLGQRSPPSAWRFGLAHRYPAVSSRTPGPMVLEIVAERM